MKKHLYTLLLVLTMTTISHWASAQHDFQINLSNLILYEINVNYEFLELNENTTLGAFGGYVYGFPDQDDHRYYYFGPELRFYPFPIKGADLFFIGIYSRYKNGYTDMEITENGYNSANNESFYNSEIVQSDYQKVAVGFNLGMKWVTDSNIIFGFNTALGRNAYFHYETPQYQSSIKNQSDSDSYNKDEYIDSNDSKYWDFRIGVHVGYRFGRTAKASE
ncbi:hypothetical protein SAMN04488028_105208 [Reichenbachiella agariperforans]|uniref:Outer membrane protein beta-barrel domain-containing protein n=1 Tax=Reichenbachiella agariperforans TaxID=156994 RepID=A0A1M6SYG4_REIAG|nr:DUF3575 domain-containing protein [Reichenbachiella agariperforans]SHK49771.1 hypothetical protein SAMN04488028_105208 [Reichenbachiella agariperforans]